MQPISYFDRDLDTLYRIRLQKLSLNVLFFLRERRKFWNLILDSDDDKQLPIEA